MDGWMQADTTLKRFPGCFIVSLSLFMSCCNVQTSYVAAKQEMILAQSGNRLLKWCPVAGARSLANELWGGRSDPGCGGTLSVTATTALLTAYTTAESLSQPVWNSKGFSQKGALSSYSFNFLYHSATLTPSPECGGFMGA